MAEEAIRQHKLMAMGRGALSAVSGKPTGPKFAKGGYLQGTNMHGKAVTSKDKVSPPGARFTPRNARSGPQAIQTGAARNMGNVPTTTITQKRPIAGFSRHVAKKI